jgi:DNA polymerase III delta prime subunit
MTDEEAEHQAALEKAIQKSLAEYQLSAPEVVDNEVDTDEDDNVKLAIQMSKEEPDALANEEEMIRLALQKSKDEAESTQTEEDIMLEYAKKQSLLQEEHRQAMAGKQREEPEVHSAADEEALNKAIEESLKARGGAGASGSGSGA